MSIPSAADTLRGTPHYRRDAFLSGLRRCGYAVGEPPKPRPDPSDVLVIWNRGIIADAHAKRYEAAGAKVIVVENGYIGADEVGHQLYAMALGHHLGAGQWKVGGDDRWDRLKVEPLSWRNNGRDIVVLPQRGIGEPGVAMPMGWTEDVVKRLRKVTDRPIRVRLHPGKDRTDPLVDLRGAWAAVTWASGAGIKSILYGIPVFCEMPSWIGLPAARFGVSEIETPFLGDRMPMFRRLAWSQWKIAEIERGEPFRWLLG